MKTIEKFCGQKNGYSRSITLRNRLIPVGKTQENLDALKLLDSDIVRANSYQEVKNIIDDFHRSFIEDVLSKTKIEWGPLYNSFESYRSETDKIKKASKKKELDVLQGVARKNIVKKFTTDPRYAKLFKKELLTELLPDIIKSAPADQISDKEDALNVFDKFSSYFIGFHENRKNMYSEEEKSTAISYRIVNENFPKFFSNIQVFNHINEKFPEIITETEKSLGDYLNGKKLKDIFNPESFNEFLAQSGIDFYNTVIGGISLADKKEKIQGLNEKINLARQQLPQERKNELRGKMTVLFKQILSDRETASFIPAGFESNEDVYESVKEFNKNVVTEVIKATNELFAAKSEYDLNQIYVPAKNQTAFSLSIFGNWSIIREGLFLLEQDKSAKELSEKASEKLSKEIEKKDVSLVECFEAYERWCKKTESICAYQSDRYFSLEELRNEGKGEKSTVNIFSALNNALANVDFDKVENLQQNKEAATPIKNYLDEVQSLYHYLQLVDYRGEDIKDTAFYSKLDEILTQLSGITSLYNKVRNFVTKKPGETKKVKLNFDCPTLANGWDENKESSNDAILLKKEGKYYLGIFNPKDKPKSFEIAEDGESYYEKMIYKLLPGPNKMLPKVFFSTKGQETFLPPKDILLGYDQGKHKKGETFDKEFMYKLIDWFKNAISRHEDWKKFEFKFSDTHSYEDMSGFYKEVELQGYKVNFQNVSAKHIDSLVDSGKLFLFQIYNKDFAEKAEGKKNLHTLYWENLFSKENLEDVCLKLNGEAEIFWRPASLEEDKVTKHAKGSMLVNRTTSDGKSIQEEIYQEIYKFKNNMSDKLSDEAKKLLDSGTVVIKTATHEIVKDRHFTQDTYLFHCPITMNFKAPKITGRKFNDHVLEVLKKNPEVKIIGLDRGERHLIYLSLINQKGEIELQKTLNLVEQVRNDKTVSVDYQKKLVQKEGDRDAARKNWQTIGNIKELKEGYLSNVIHEIAKLMVENNAIVVMEDLNFGFKRGRFAVERQVYQKFENMLIEKLNYLVFKDKKITEPGGVLNAYQLTDKSANVSDVYRQCGWLFYIPAAYTSKIDPKTGFANLLDFNDLTNVHKKRDFFAKFDEVHFDSETKSFAFTFDYKNFDGKGKNEMSQTKWTVYSRENRICYDKNTKSSKEVSVTENLKSLLEKNGINYLSEQNILDELLSIGADLKAGEKPSKEVAELWDGLLWNFKLTLQMRNSIPNSEIDYLISPVKAEDGTFFDSREEKSKGAESKLPVDADANGAYHIALKGLYLLLNDFNRNEKGVIQNISNADWFSFVQEKEYLI